MFVSATSSLVLCMYNFVSNLFYLLLYFFPAGQGSSQLKECAFVPSGVSVRMENNSVVVLNSIFSCIEISVLFYFSQCIAMIFCVL